MILPNASINKQISTPIHCVLSAFIRLNHILLSRRFSLVKYKSSFNKRFASICSKFYFLSTENLFCGSHNKMVKICIIISVLFVRRWSELVEVGRRFSLCLVRCVCLPVNLVGFRWKQETSKF